MKIARLKTPFEGMSDPIFQTTAEVIYGFMMVSIYFPTLVPELPALLVDIDAYGDALAAAKTKDKNSVAAKNDARDKLTETLIHLAASVTAIAKGNRTILISSGFELEKEGEGVIIVKPNTVILTDGAISGEMVIKVPAVKGAKAYAPMYTADPLTEESQWTQFLSSTSKFTFKGMVPGTRYWARMGVLGPNGQIVYSDAISRVAQ